MGYHVVDPEDVEAMSGRSATALSITEHIGHHGSGTPRSSDRHDAKLGLRLYEAGPGEQIPLRYHYHDEQIEAFYVIDGCVNFETPDGTFVVGQNNFFVVESGNPHRGYVPEGGEESRVIAIGAPSVNDGHEYDPEERLLEAHPEDQ